MNQFLIAENYPFLNQNIRGFYHTDFGGIELPNNPNYLYKLKNDPHHNWSDKIIQEAQFQLRIVLINEIPEILNLTEYTRITVCVVPRSKRETFYRPNQLLFRETIRDVVLHLGDNFIDGTHFIIRHTNTRTTHLRIPIEGFDNDGRTPYPGITIDTCNMSDQIIGQNILLIDDIYTNNINIDEDVIQALLTNGANSVVFYAIGKTIAHQ